MSEAAPSPQHAHPNFRRSFTDGYTFSHDGMDYEIRVQPVGTLRLPSGQIVAADPSSLDTRVDQYFQRTVAAGEYLVEASILRTHGQNLTYDQIACLRIRFSEEPIQAWEMATTRDQDLSQLQPFHIYGYGVDAGMGCVVDALPLRTLYQRYTMEGKTLFEDFYFQQVLPAYEASDGLGSILIDAETGANLIFCSSGAGDGYYASYWGLSAINTPVVLVTDFGLLNYDVYGTQSLGQLTDLFGQTQQLNLPAGSLNVQLEQRDASTLFLEIEGNSVDTCEFEVNHNNQRLEHEGIQASYSHNRRTMEIYFPNPIPTTATLRISYLERIGTMI